MLLPSVRPHEYAYYTFRPRPDQPQRYDQQSSFYNSNDKGVSWLIGGNGAGTTSCSLAKVAKFVYETPPPRRDTPFWIIANTYEQVMKTCWVEKLHGHGHILPQDVDWQRIAWYRSTAGWPYRVPLKPHANGNNWVLEFKSYEQGRSKMQAEAIGGFLFVEQFPYPLLEEVLRGCREYNFPGSKLCEFTPVDPNMSVEIEMMIEEDDLPPGWKVYRANTECAMEAGHVSKEWFHEFFGMVPEAMRETRMTGRFATYEGAIYPGFNPLVHLVGDDVISFPPNIHHRRAIDWGAGPDNPFAAIWAYRDSLGIWYIYDEEYSASQDKTTIDHLCDVQDAYPWPQENPHYGNTYADPSSPDNIRIAMKLPMYAMDEDGVPRPPISITPASNRVLEGIEHVQYLLKVDKALSTPDHPNGRPRLYIHKENCKNLARELRSYQWLRSSMMGINPVNPRREPRKKDDHLADSLRYLTFSEAARAGGTIESRRKTGGAAGRSVRLAKTG
jgi:hypothetical protein